jgi:hypothetical protein
LIKKTLTLPVVKIHLDPLEQIGQDDVQCDVAATSHHRRDQGLEVKPIKDVLGIKFFLINILQCFLQDLLQSIKIRLLLLKLPSRLASLILRAVASILIVQPLLIHSSQLSIVSKGDLPHFIDELKL